MRRVFTYLLITSLSINLFATGQITDKINYKGNKYELLTLPLEDYFIKNPEKRPTPKIVSTGLWRGYIATFELINAEIFVKDIKVKDSFNGPYKSVFKKVFPNKKNVKLEWYSGLLVVVFGNATPKAVGLIIYENYIVLEVNKGNIVKEKQFNYNQFEVFKNNQFNFFRKTEDYNKVVISLKKHHIKEVDSLIKFDILNYTKKILVEQNTVHSLGR